MSGWSDTWTAVGLALGAALVSASVAPEQPFDVDSVLLARGVVEFDPAAVRPHAPGYPLLVGLAKCLTALGLEPLAALRAVAHASVAGLVLATFALARTLDARRPPAAAALVAVAPITLQYGAVANAYVLGAACVTGMLAAASRGPAVLGILFGVACAARPSLLLFAAPVAAVAVGRSGAARFLAGALPVGGVALAACAVASGGLGPYLDAVATSWGRGVALQGDRLAQLHLGAIHGLQALAGALLLLPGARAGWTRLPDRSRRLLGAWLLPFALLAVWSDAHGYVLLYLPAVALVLTETASSRGIVAALIASLVWFWAPTPPAAEACDALPAVSAELRVLRLPSAAGLRGGDGDLRAWRALLDARIDPDRTALVALEALHPVVAAHLAPTARVDGPDAREVLLPSEGTRLLVVACEAPGEGWTRHDGARGARVFERELTAEDRGTRPAGLQLHWVD